MKIMITAHDPTLTFQRSVEDVVVVSSDLVTDVSLQDVLDQHRGRGADLTVLTSPAPPQATPPGPKTKTHLSK